MATRRERVVLDLQDDFSAKMARAAAATALLKRELNDLSGKAVQTDRATRNISKNNDDISKSAKRAEADIDKLSGRLRILAEVATLLAPAGVSIGAVTVPAVTGLASALGFAAIGAGTAVLAFQGVGDALKAVNKAGLEPTTENLTAAKVALAGLSPAAANFVKQIRDMLPELKQLRDTAAGGFLPGLTTGLDQLEGALPRVEKLIGAVSTELGAIAAEAGTSLASDRWAPFLEFVADEAPNALGDLAAATGNTAHAMAELWMATTPLNNGFMSWLVDATADLDRWAGSLSKTEGFAEFVAYVEQNGPQVAETFAAIADASLEILEAIAPLGGPVLKGLEAVANAIGAIADSELGTPIFAGLAALSLYNRTLAVTASLQKGTFGGPAVTSIKAQGTALRGLAADITLVNRAQGASKTPRGFIGPQTQAQAARQGLGDAAKNLGKTAALLGGIAVAATGAADSIGLTNTTSLALAGTMAGPLGTALGTAGGLTLDLAAAASDLSDKIDRANNAAARGDIEGLSKAIAELDKQSNDLASHDGIKDWIDDQFKDIIGGDTLSKIGGAFAALNPLNAVALAGAKTNLFGLGKSGSEEFASAADTARAALMSLQTAARVDMLQDFISAGLDPTDAALRQAAMSADEFAKSLIRAQNVLGKRDSLRDYQASLDAMVESIKKNKQNLDITTEAGRENQAALDGIASSAIEASKTLSDPTRRSNFLQSARRDFIAAARALGLTKIQAQNLATELGLLNQVRAKPKVDSSSITGAQTKATQLARVLAGLEGPHNVMVNVNTTGKEALDGLLMTPGSSTKPPKKRQAEGGSVPKTGMPYADRHHYLLADGEEVISNRHGQADRWRPVLKAINANRLAGGGTAGYKDDLAAALNSETSSQRSNRDKTEKKRHDAAYERGLKRWNKALEQSEKIIDKERSKRQELIDARSDLVKGVGDKFRSDIFATPDRPSNFAWMSAGDRAKFSGDPFSILQKDINSASDFQKVLKVLKAKGLDGQAFAAVAQGGDIDQARALANRSKGDIAYFERLYKTREVAAGQTGALAGNTVYNAQIAAQTRELKASLKEQAILRREFQGYRKEHRNDDKKLARAINGAAPRKRP